MAATPARPAPLRRSLGVVDATTLGVGSMVGAGVFVVLSPVAARAGGLLWAALLAAAGIAVANALAVAALAAAHPASGGAYLYGRLRLGQWPGFVAGWGFVTGKTASCAAMAYTFATYAAPGVAVPLAIGAVAAVTGVNLLGITRTAGAARLLVAPVVGLLAFVVAASFAAPRPAEPPPAAEQPTAWAVLQAAGLLFFAFAGYARVATLGEEVRDPERTIPAAIALALGFTLVLYGLLAAALVHLLGVGGLAAATAPVREAVVLLGAPAWLAAAGAALASLGALMALVAGISRTALAMAREGDLPGRFAAVSAKRSVPWLAEVSVAAVVVVLLLSTDATTIIGFSSFGVLVYYAVANASALTLPPRARTERARRQPERPWYCPRWLNAAGLAGCLLLAFTLPGASVATMLAVFAAGLAGRAVALAVRRRDA
ncbi:amino acid permease [Arthrobacter ginkgonis]|uniref:Amino acid permease n=1 Tax=Arthrobacter ginkgonis TaxID=1630594 RepID=A0ABP7CL63_9MICC